MEPPMLRRRLNPFLLISTVLILSLLAGLTVIYQDTLANVEDRKQDLKDQVNQTEQEIKQLEADKRNLTRQIRDKEDEISRLDSLLDSKEQEVQQLSQRITTLENQLENADTTSNVTRQVNDTLGRVCIDEKSTLSDTVVKLCRLEGHETS